MDLEKYLENSFMEEFFKQLIVNSDHTRVINAIVDIAESLKSILQNGEAAKRTMYIVI